MPLWLLEGTKILQDKHHIYKTEPISTFAFNQMEKFNPERCPCGCHVQKEGNRLRLLNQECPEHTENLPGSYLPMPSLYDENGNPNPYYSQDYTSGGYHLSYDPGFPSSHHNPHFDSMASVDSILVSDNFTLPQYDHFQSIQSGVGNYFNPNGNTTYDYGSLPYDQGFPSYDSAFSTINDTNFNASDGSFSQLPSNDNTFPTYDLNFSIYGETSNNNDYMSYEEFMKSLDQTYGSKLASEEVDFDLNSREHMNGNEMIVYEKGNKTYIISPEQYKLLILGFNRSFSYRFDDPSYKTSVEAINHALGDVDFNDATIGMEDILLDSELKTENGLVYGWASDDYKMKRTYCEADSAIWYDLTIDCKSPRSFKKYL